MLKEALALLFDKAEAQAATKQARHFTIPQLPDKVYIEHNGMLTPEDVNLPPRNHSVLSVKDFVESVKRFAEAPLVPAIWLNGNGLKAILDDGGHRREHVTFQLMYSELFALVNKLASSEVGMDQRTLSGYLRRDFRNAPGAVAMLNTISKIKFTSKEDSVSAVGHGNDTLGISVEKAVTGVGEIPETLSINVQLYKNLHEEFTFYFTLTLEIDTENKKFILRPMPEQITEAINASLLDIRERVEAEFTNTQALVFFGTP